MTVFRLPDGYQVRAVRRAGRTEFETRNPDGDVISNVSHHGVAASRLLAELRRKGVTRW